MIKTNELMLGNWVELGNGNCVKITGIIDISCSYVDSKTNETHVCTNTSFHGIPITAELLEKFVYLGHDRICKIGDTILHQTRQGFEICLFGQFIQGIQFLHELQNAYFMLTKKQLEVKL